MTISTRVISNPDGLLEIEKSWNTLIGKCSENPFFLSRFVEQFMEFYRSWGWTPLVLVTSTDNTIVGIAPLMTKKKFGFRFVKFLSKSGFSPDFIFDDQYRETCITNTLDFLFKTLRCQFVDLTLPAESPNLRILKQKCKTNKIFFSTIPEMGHCVIPIKHTWDDFKRLRGKNFRRKFKKTERNLDRAGSWRIVCVESGNEESDAIEKILDVERTSWKEAWRAQRGIKMDKVLMIIWKASRYTARIEPDFKWSVRFLELNDQPLAYVLVLQYKEMAFCVKTSYDDRYKRLSPGTYVNNSAVRELFNKDQVRNIDFLTDIPLNRTWTSICLPRVRVMMSRNIMGFVYASAYLRKILDVISWVTQVR